jgi:hypothetical protein
MPTLFELIGPPSEAQARRLVTLLRLAPGQRPVSKSAMPASRAESDAERGADAA